MDAFGFTHKKFLKCSPQGQHRHLIKWLSCHYQKLLGNRVSPGAFTQFVDQYNGIRAWMNLPPLSCPPAEGKYPLAFVSDAVHFHRSQLDMGVTDPALLPRVQTGDTKAPRHKAPTMEIMVALDGLRSLFNVGSIFRTCDAAGVKGIILGNTPGKENPRVAKTAMGSHGWMAQEKTEDLFQTLMDKKDQGFTIIGVETVESALPCHGMPWPPKMVLVFGNEEYGISPQVMGACDAFVSIPMFG
ncbi:MAG: hypothetical protein MI749_18250, partial [Desulfovibrionales bacterium]|nr:hypothetical protein [Desulfovibrionales bacterium]